MIPRIGRRDHFGNAENRCDLRGLQRARPAEGDKRKAARVDALLDRTGADRVRHVGVDDGENALRRLAEAEAELGRKPADGPARRFRVELHAPAEEITRVEPADNQIGVRHGRFFAAPPVGGGPRNRARAARSDPKRSAMVDIGDRAAARADGVDVDHRREQREAGDGCRARVRFRQLSVDDDSDVRARAAMSNVISLRRSASPPIHAPASTPAANPESRVSVGFSDTMLAVATPPFEAMILRSAPSPARLSDRSRWVIYIRTFGPMKAANAAVVNRSNSRNCGDTKEDVVTNASGRILRHDRLDAVLMRRIEVGEQKADGDGFHASLAKRDRRAAHPLFIQGLELLPVRRRQASLDHHAVAAFDQWTILPGQLLPDRVVLDPLMASDMQNVAEAFIGDHACPGALVLEHRIGRGRRRVEDEVDLVGLSLSRREQALDALHHAV